MKSWLAALAAAAAGCAPIPPAEAVDDAVDGTGKCDAAPAQSLLGKLASPSVNADAKRRTGAGRLRVIPEGGAVTMDYSDSRLNLQLDGKNRIVRIYCG